MLKFTKKILLYINMLYFLGIFLLIKILFATIDYKYESIFIIASYFIAITIYSIAIFKDGSEIFYPIHFVTILYLCIFIFCPIYLIFEGRTGIKDTYVMDGCIKSTAIFLVSYGAFIGGYLTIKAPKFNEFENVIKEELSEGFRQRLILLCLSIWLLGMLINLYSLIKNGMSISYIFSLGQGGSYKINENLSNISFISNFGYFMVIPWLYILHYSNRKILKLIITFITASLYLIRGFRFIIIIMVLAFILCYYRKKKRHPKMHTVIIVFTMLLMFISIMGYMRHGLRTGEEINWGSFNIKQILYALETNFNIYKPFYGLVTHYPSLYSYTLGKSMIWETLTHFIPRAIWPNKPLAKYSTVAIAMKNSTSDFTYDTAAMAWPNLGEYYMEFGIIGCIIFMFVFGFILKKIILLYKSNNMDDIILYSIFFGFVMQIVTRGYSPITVGLLLFLYAPALVIRMYSKKGRIGKNE